MSRLQNTATALRARRQIRNRAWAVLIVCAAAAPALAADVLVADRLTNSVYRYSETGTLLNTVVAGGATISQPAGLALSPDLKHLYVSSFQSSRVVRYDYDYATGTASAAVIFADQADGIASPNAILFSRDAQTIYVSNLGGTGVARFMLDGTKIGSGVLFGAAPESTTQTQFSGLALAPATQPASERVFVNGFQSFPAGTEGAVGLYTAPAATMSAFIPSSTAINGASGLLVHNNYLYVTGMFAGTLRRFDIDTGAPDNSFGLNNLPFPQGLALSPDGNGFLMGILGFTNGTGRIAHYGFDGMPIGDGVFAVPGSGGYAENTAFVNVPDRADFNFDLRVDAADLALWRQNVGNAAGTATHSMGDADLNGVVDGADFLVWQRGLSMPASPLTPSHPAPEPAGVSMVLAALLSLLLRRTPRETAT